MPLVSVIIPCYNLGEYIDEAVDSVLGSTFQDFEIIIINDGSTDDFTNKKLLTYKKQKTTVYFTENQGLPAARNTGVLNSSGKYILPLDADDFISKDYLKEAVELLENNRALSIVYCNAEKFGDDSGPWILPDYSLNEMLRGSIIFVTSFFRRVDFDLTGGWRLNMSYNLEDWDLWLSIIENGGSVYKIPKTHFYYRIRKDSITRTRDQEQLKSVRRQVFMNHINLYSAHFEDPINLYLEKEQILKHWKTRAEYIEQMPEYKIGYYFLRPYRIFRRLVLGSE